MSIGDDTNAKVSQDAGVQEREFSVPEVISEGEKPSSSILDVSVDHKGIMKQPSSDDSAALKGVAQDFTNTEEKPSPEPTVDHSPPDSSNLPSSEIPVSVVSTDATSISVGLENKISSQEPGVLEKELDSTPRDVIGIDSQPESRLIEGEAQILEKPKGIDIPIGSPQAGLLRLIQGQGMMLLKEVKKSLSLIMKLVRNLCQVLINQIKMKLFSWTVMFLEMLK